MNALRLRVDQVVFALRFSGGTMTHRDRWWYRNMLEHHQPACPAWARR